MTKYIQINKTLYNDIFTQYTAVCMLSMVNAYGPIATQVLYIQTIQNCSTNLLYSRYRI